MAKILLIADGRSPTARSWIAHLFELGYEISLVSTYPFEPIEGVNETIVFPWHSTAFITAAWSKACWVTNRDWSPA